MSSTRPKHQLDIRVIPHRKYPNPRPIPSTPERKVANHALLRATTVRSRPSERRDTRRGRRANERARRETPCATQYSARRIPVLFLAARQNTPPPPAHRKAAHLRSASSPRICARLRGLGFPNAVPWVGNRPVKDANRGAQENNLHKPQAATQHLKPFRCSRLTTLSLKTYVASNAVASLSGIKSPHRNSLSTCLSTAMAIMSR
jgi:hypothetical protein